MADVLLINMWYTDIGRYSGSNYGLLKVIFECNLKLFGQSTAKKLLFVIRDYPGGKNADAIKGLIDKDINQLWQDIHKPDQYKDSLAQEFFSIEFCLMPHKLYCEDQFVEKCKELKEKFTAGSENNFFPEIASDAGQGAKAVPIDGLSYFIDTTWAIIKDQKELNLPDQREMVAQYRCNEVKEEALELIKTHVQALDAKSRSSSISDFPEQGMGILEVAVKHYKQEAVQYKGAVYDKVLKEIAETVFQKLFVCFEAQLKLNTHKVTDEFESKIRKMTSKRDLVNDTFHRDTTKLKQELSSKFKKESADLIIENSGWGEFVQ